jgi:hypothetical protein
MNSRWFERHPLAVFVSITLAALVAGLGLLFFVWLLLRVLGVNTGLWPMIEALSTALTAAAVLGAAFVASRELSELASSRHLDVADKLFEELNSQENIEARRWVFLHLPENPADAGEVISSLQPEGRDAIKTVLNSLDRIAFLTQSDWIPDEMVMPWMNPMVVKAWAKLAPYVEYERQRRHEPDYYRTAQQLAERCLAWREQHVPEARLTWVEDAL